jgi:hypothetical protein
MPSRGKNACTQPTMRIQQESWARGTNSRDLFDARLAFFIIIR